MKGYETLGIAAGHARIRAFVRGAGPTVVMLSGMGRPPSDLEAFGKAVADSGYKVAICEYRGVGESTGPLDGITFHDLAKDVIAVIDKVGGAPVALIGHAFGNRIARTLAADRPDLVSCVVMLGASGKVQPSPEIAAAIRIAQSMHLPRKDREAAVRLAWVGPGRDPSGWLDENWSQPFIKGAMAAAERTPLSEFWTAGKAPILIVQGLADVSAPPANGRSLKEEVGDRATLVELEGVGHSMAVEAPDECAKPVLDYLAKRVRR
ncbi:MAG: alpha/beta hydrolase [Alphaproteobacteria bacterium]|nr:alpha/beta hydrolase [Alphaproteobacteria bacterium]